MDPRVHQLHLSRELSLLSILKCVFVFSPCGEQEHTISTPQISAHTVSLLSYTPVTIHQFAITHTHTHPSFVPLQPPLFMPCLLMKVCPLHFIVARLQGGRVCVCVCRLCVFFLPPACSDHQPWTMNCSDKLSVSRSAKWSQSVWQTYLKSWRATFVPPVSPLNLTSFVEHGWQFSTDLK